MTSQLVRECTYSAFECETPGNIWSLAKCFHTVHLYVKPSLKGPRRGLYSGVLVERPGIQLEIETEEQGKK